MIGNFGTTVFTSSSGKVLTYTALNKSAGARYAEHALILRKPLLEFTGPSLTEVTYNIRLDASHGVSPESEIKKLTDARDNGIAKPLFFGDKFQGNFVITNISESRKVTNPRTGDLWLADIALTIKEYVDDRS